MHVGKFNITIAEIEKGREGDGYEISVQTANRTFTGAHCLIDTYAGAILVLGTGDQVPVYVDLDAVVAIQLHDA